MADKILKTKTFEYIYIPLLFVLACIINIAEVEIYGAGLFLLIAAFMLVVSSKLAYAMLPVLLVTVFVTKCYNALGNEVYKYQISRIIWLAVPVVAAVIFHFVFYRKKFKIGRSFYGICAISVALILGGIGTIPTKDYFSPTALFYVFALGLGMMGFYVLVKSHSDEHTGIEVVEILYAVGLFAVFSVLMFYVRDWDKFIFTEEFLHFQSSNNLSTFLMIAMPIPLYYAIKNPLHLISMICMYVAIIFTGSRGGLLMGTAELFVLLFAYVVFYPENWKQRTVSVALTILLVVATVYSMPYIAKFSGIVDVESGGDTIGFRELCEKVANYLVRGDEARFKFLERLSGDFKGNPLFGTGIGYQGNVDVYNPVGGAMNWYHMWFAQVIGGLGICGILAYGYQLIDRIIIFFKNRNNLTLTLMLSYIGLFLMSQVNPGEFCPVPYSMLAVTFFIIMEDKVELPKIKCKKHYELFKGVVSPEE